MLTNRSSVKNSDGLFLCYDKKAVEKRKIRNTKQKV